MKQKLFSLVMAACLLFSVLTSLAMLLYPGGTRSDPNSNGYRFFENFFSELGLSQSYAGGQQTASYILFTVALSLAGVALILYYCLAPSLFWENTKLKFFSLFGSVFGILSGASFIGVAFTPADLYLTAHSLFVQLAFLTFFIAVTFYACAIFMHPGFPNQYGWINLSFGILLGIYIWLLFNGPGLETQNGLIIQVTGQKLIAYAAIACMFITAYGSRRVLEKQPKKLNPESYPDTQLTSS
jgi:hypothetical protein